MHTFEAIRTLLAVRSYQDRPVPEESIRRIVEAGRLTGSSRNVQPWHFIIVQDREMLRRLGELALTGPYIAEAPLGIIVAIDRVPSAISDASRAIQSMLLTAWEDGLGSNWVGFDNLNAVRPLLNIPDELNVFAILSVGYPADKIEGIKKQRKSLAEIAHRERFGQPFE